MGFPLKKIEHRINNPFTSGRNDKFHTGMDEHFMQSCITAFFANHRQQSHKNVELRLDTYGYWTEVYEREMTPEEVEAKEELERKTLLRKERELQASIKRKETLRLKEIEQLKKLAAKHPDIAILKE